MAFEEGTDDDEFEDLGDLGDDVEDELHDGLEEDIEDEEREALEQDLVDVRALKAVLGLRGIRGIVVWCPECETDHYLGWDLLAGNLQQILQDGEPPVHEPAWDPDPDEYVTWDYARGFLDGVENYPDDGEGLEKCGYCGISLPEEGPPVHYCPECGESQAPVRLMLRLRREGWSGERVADLLKRSGFELPVFDPSEPEDPSDHDRP